MKNSKIPQVPSSSDAPSFALQIRDDAVYEVSEGARLHFIKFETKHIEATMDYIQQCIVGANTKMYDNNIKVTGGGAYKYAELIEKKLGLTIDKEDEMQCMIRDGFLKISWLFRINCIST